MAEMEIFELDKTLQVDGKTYNINAVQADKVVNSLNIYKSNLNKKATKLIEFDGSTAKSIDLVPASGGSFAGRITVPPVSDTTLKSDGETVLNYNDIVGKVVDRLLNTSAMATWDNNKLTFTDTETPAVHGICVVLGDEANVGDFANQNHTSKWIPNYLYICKDTGNIFLGKAESTETNLLSGITKDKTITPRNIEVAAGQWITNNAYGLDMANSDVINLNGLFFADYANQYNEGINFIRDYNKDANNSDIKDPEKVTEIIVDRVYARDGKLCFEPNRKVNEDLLEAPYEVYHSGMDTTIPVANGGTGQSDLANVTVGKATRLETPCDIQTNLASTTAAGFDGTTAINPGVTGTLPVANGGTGQTSLDNVTVGQSKKIKVSYKKDTSTNATDKYINITIAPSASYTNGPTGGSDGDIMILF